MCGIVGIFGDPEAYKKLKTALNLLKERGKDSFGVSDGKTELAPTLRELKIPKVENLIGHCLHAVVGHVPQPLMGRGRLVSNCEIYNWKELMKKYPFKAENDSEMLLKLIELKGPENLPEILEGLRGTYAFAYWIEDRVYLARDIIGIKPLWYSLSPGFAFASEKKALPFHRDVKELNPRKILVYDLKRKRASFFQRKFFSITPEINRDKEYILNKLEELISEAVKIRIPDKKFGLLFSGGLDSTILAVILKKMGADFTCYVAALKEDAEDIIYAKKAASALNLKLKIKIVPLEELEDYIEKIVPLIEDSNVVKVGVALPIYAASELAKEDGLKVIFSALGADELFGGYYRYRKSLDINKDCLSDIIKMYEKNTYRDDVVTMYHNLELRVPFLDKKIVDFSLKIPARYKIQGDMDKAILRELAGRMGVPGEIALRRKKAAQYGSRFDYGINKLAKRTGKSKSEYLRDFYKEPNIRLGVLFSSGKDSTFALDIMRRQNYSVECLISLISKNPESYMFHTPNIHMVELQAEAMGIPLVLQETEGHKEEELFDMEKALKRAKQDYDIQGVVTGALYSNYQRERIERVCDKLGLKIFSPLWHMNQEKEMRQILKKGYKFIFSSVASYGLDKSWLAGKITEKDVDRLVELNKKYRINIAGEGGEFESLVLDGPIFKKAIKIEDYDIIEENENTARMLVKKAKLVDKE